jgi:major intrinsic protein
MPIGRRIAAECVDTFRLVLGGCGSAVISAAFPQLGIGLLGVALAFGLTVLTMAYAVGHISGCHLNPAVSVGLWAGKRFPGRDLAPYILAQVIGAVVGAEVFVLTFMVRRYLSAAGPSLNCGCSGWLRSLERPLRAMRTGGSASESRSPSSVKRRPPQPWLDPIPLVAPPAATPSAQRSSAADRALCWA